MCGVHIGEVTVVAHLQGKKKVELWISFVLKEYVATWQECSILLHFVISDMIICMNM